MGDIADYYIDRMLDDYWEYCFFEEVAEERVRYVIKRGIWLTQNQGGIPISEMSDQHLRNTIKAIEEGRIYLLGMEGEIKDILLREYSSRLDAMFKEDV